MFNFDNDEDEEYEGQVYEVETSLPDPEEMIEHYFNYFKHQVRSNEDLSLALSAFFNDIYYYAYKKHLISEVDAKMSELVSLDKEEER